ncbi:S8 family peptidase [uncultured Eudoraea sp.]|jgi:subtilisin family serine protease|uniref:S8 family peptidase n=1 Tax=uncultured Eudoraea sp. TaxID=1035614 RepID=UPI00261D5D40|nr:S8 family peptidase [uncultured Eudoraea sp.]
MTIKHLKSAFYISLVMVFLAGCGSTALVLTPLENIDTMPLKISELTDEENKTWGHADLISDTIPGISLNKAYDDIIKNKKGKKVIVAVLDSGIDLDHEDLDDVIWTNKDERPGNGVDDDNNGYIDDIHGYNFLGEAYNEQLEYVRIIKFKMGDNAIQEKAKAELQEELSKIKQNKERYEQILSSVKDADAAIKNHLGKSEYSKKDVIAIKTEDQALLQSASAIKQMYNFADSIPDVFKQLNEGITYFTERLNYHLNVDFDGRKIVGDNPYDLMDLGYGDGNPKNRVISESHGTHVAGIIAAERDNGLGVNGVANNVEIMSIRAVPNGDEYDKDIALGIRYAVDNGAQIINASFGKSYSLNSDWVYDAIKYAAANDVLIVHAAGNDGLDLDDPKNTNFPNDQADNKGTEIADNLITIGALNGKYGSEMVASFSNYGKMNVDVFAPGGNIYSTMPENNYEFQGGTSMAAPMVSGIAALIRSYYPKLTASEVKRVLIESGLSTSASVILAGDTEKTKPFDQASKSGKMVNAYNALIMASNMSKSL